MTDYFMNELAAEVELRERMSGYHAAILSNLKRELQQTIRQAPVPVIPSVVVKGRN
jgi:hypothetical protein